MNCLLSLFKILNVVAIVSYRFAITNESVDEAARKAVERCANDTMTIETKLQTQRKTNKQFNRFVWSCHVLFGGDGVAVVDFFCNSFKPSRFVSFSIDFYM